MAKKTFGELNGVQLKKMNPLNGNVCNVTYCDKENDGYVYSMKYNGDSLFVVDAETMAIRTCVVKFVRGLYYGSSNTIVLGYCDKNKNTTYMPTHDEVMGYKLREDIEIVRLPLNKSQYGVYATNLADALVILNRLKEHNAFMFAKKGDDLFVMNRITNNVEKLTIRRISSRTGYKTVGNPYSIRVSIEFTDNTLVNIGMSQYYSKASIYNDYDFSLRMRGNYTDDSRYFLYTTEEEALSDLNAMIKRYEAAKKKVKKEFEKGSEIKLKDCKQNVLHIGDTVAYIRNSGQGTLMGVGVIVKETKVQIQIFDKEDREHIRNLRRERNEQFKNSPWYHERQVEKDNDGYYFVSSGKLLLIQEYIKRK